MNLIPLNPTGGFAGRPPDRERINRLRGPPRGGRRDGHRPPQPRRRHRRRVRPAPRPRGASTATKRRPVAPERRRIRDNGPVNERRFVNRSQPQTLYMAVILCYIEVVFNLLGGLPAPDPRRASGSRRAATGSPTRRSGATRSPGGAAVAAGRAAVRVLRDRHAHRARAAASTSSSTARSSRCSLHPMSRDYQRIWFR